MFVSQLLCPACCNFTIHCHIIMVSVEMWYDSMLCGLGSVCNAIVFVKKYIFSTQCVLVVSMMDNSEKNVWSNQ